MKMNVNKLVKMGVLSALSVVLMLLVRFPIIPAAPFLEYDPADIPILVGTFLYGPFAGLVITVVVSLIQSLTLSAQSGWVGFVMHVIATGTLAIVAGAIYRKMHTRKGAIIALIAGCLSMTFIMIPSNLIFTVIFLKVPIEAVKSMIFPVIIPFNLIKSVTNSIVVMAVYKAVARVFRESIAAPAWVTKKI